MVLRWVDGPHRPHRFDVLEQHPEAVGSLDAVVGELLEIPAGSDAEEHPIAGEMGEAGNCFRKRDRMVLGGQADAGAQVQCAGGCGGRGQRDEGVEGTAVHPRQLATLGRRTDSGGRDVSVFSDE